MNEQDDDFWTAYAMRQEGGSFVRKLGEAFAVADDFNRMKLIEAFSDYWNSYVARGQKLKAADDGLEASNG